MTVFVATAHNAVGSYDITAVGATEEEAMRLLKRAVRKARKQAGREPWPTEYFDDIFVAPLTVGKAYYDEGRAGEVAL